MGSLSNLYISQSYQSLIHLATNNTASATLIDLQDGLGNSIGVSVNTGGDLYLSGSLTASLQQGYLLVGGANGKTYSFPTSSLVSNVNTSSLVTTASFNAYTASNDSKVNQLINATSSYAISSSVAAVDASQQSQINSLIAATGSYVTSTITASSLVTASFSGNTLTFTKGDSSTFGVVIPDISGSTINTGSFATTGSNTFFGQETFNGNLVINESGSAFGDALLITSGRLRVDEIANYGGDLNISAGGGGVGDLNLSNVFGGNSIKLQLSGINSITGDTELTGTIDITGNLTASLQEGFTYVGDASGRTTLVATSSFGGGATIPAGTVSSSAQITALGFVSSSITASSLVTASVNLNTITFTKGDATTFNITVDTGSAITTDITSLNAFTASQETKDTTLESVTASLQAFTASQQILNGTFTTTASFNAYTQSNDQRVTSLETNSASVNISISNINSATASLFTSTSLALVTASFAGNTLTFTKGDASTFGVVIPDISGSAGTTIFEVVYTGENITKGDPLYISGSQGANPRVFIADAADPNKMPVTFVSNETIGVSNTTNAIVLGLIEGIDLTGYVAGQSIYVAEGGGWSASLPSGSNSVTQLLGVVTKGGSGGKGLVLNPGPAQLPGLDTGYMWVGSSTNQPVEITTASFASSASFNQYTQSNDSKVDSLINATASYVTSAITASSLITASVSLNTITFTKGDASTFNITVDTGSGGGGGTISVQDEGTILGTATSFDFNGAGVTATLSAGTASITIPGGGGTIDTGSFATTGSNTFTGDQTLIDNSGNFFTISDASGSMMLVGKSYTSASAHLSASVPSPSGSWVNLIFKINNNTADTIISGSGNTFTNPLAPTAGFKRYVGGQNNIYNTAAIPQISSSMAFPVAMSGNVGPGSYTFRGPVSSSAWTINNNYNAGAIQLGIGPLNRAERIVSGFVATGNLIQGTLSVIAQQNNLTSSVGFSNNSMNGGLSLNLNSSSANLQNNLINDSNLTITNNYYTGSDGRGQISVARNTIGGQNNTILVTGIGDAGVSTQPQFNNNTMGGQNNIIFSNSTGAGSNQSIASTIIFGQSLIVSASSNINTASTLGSTFLGRFNANDGIRNKASDVVFAVGTGTNATTGRKTGFLIDTSSNTFVEGTFNVSGSVNITGSIVSTDRSNNSTNVIIGLNALGMGNPGALPLAVGNTISIAIGNGAMRFASGSQQNVAIGNNALLITTGSNNFALGSETMPNNTTGNSNVALGTNALNANTTGNQNIAIGGNSGFTNLSGSSNTYIGESAGRNILGNNNVIVGRYQGSGGETFDNNIILADGSGNIKAQYSGSAWSLQDDIKFNKGTNKTTDIVSVNGSATISNSLVTGASIILLTTQNSTTGPVYPAVVTTKGTGTFDIAHNFAGALDVAYLIINPT